MSKNDETKPTHTTEAEDSRDSNSTDLLAAKVEAYKWAALENSVTILVSAWCAYMISPWCFLLLCNIYYFKNKKSS